MPCALCGTENNPSSRFCTGCGTPLTPAPDSPAAPDKTRTAENPQGPTGQIFAGRYRIIEEVGRGGMGRVYKAFDTKVGEKIAFKLIDPEAASDPGRVLRFTRELKQARRVSHPNVCRLFDIGETEGTAFITMEYVPGESLHTMIRMTGRLGSRTAAGYARQIAAGLAETHRQGIVHRDLKPHNIMVLPDGTVKIMDFGIARSEEEPGLTSEHRIVGTPGYMSPEQSAGRSVDARSDIYALGLILYEMTTGRLPAADGPGRTPAPVRPPSDINPEIPARLNEIILKCLQTDPAGRYAAAEAIAAELEPLAEAPRTGGGTTAPVSPPRRRAWPIALAAAVILGITVGTLVLIKKRPIQTAPPVSELPWNDRLAVLPIKDLSPAGDKVLGEGLTENLRIKLGRRGPLKIISGFSCNRFQDTRAELTDIGRALKARYILSGNLLTDKGRLTVNLVLGDAEIGTNVWSGNYGETQENYFKLEDRIVAEIGEALPLRRGDQPPAGTGRPDPANLQAFNDYRLGRHFESRYRDFEKAEDFAESERAYRSALAHDPRYAKAQCGLGDLYEARYAKKDQVADLAAMLRSYMAAQALDPDDPETHLGQGWSYFYQNDMDQAYAHFKRACELDPENARVNLGTGAFFRSLGLYRKSLHYLGKAADLDPLASDPILQSVSCLFFLGQYGEALLRIQGAVKIDSQNPRIPFYSARQYLGLGLIKEAEAALDQVPVSPTTITRTVNRYRAWLAALKRDRGAALQAVRDSDRLFAYEICNAYCCLDMPGEALGCIRDGIEQGFRTAKEIMYSYLFLQGNPLFRRLESRPEYIRIRKERKALYEAMEAKYSGL